MHRCEHLADISSQVLLAHLHSKVPKNSSLRELRQVMHNYAPLAEPESQPARLKQVLQQCVHHKCLRSALVESAWQLLHSAFLSDVNV